MKNLTLSNIAACTGGSYVGPLDKKDLEVTSITSDSRRIESGCLFVAIKGARMDGHDFAAKVIEEGAMAVLSEKELAKECQPYILVSSTLQAVKDMAEFYLKQLAIPVVGIVGSVGKTTTKEMVAEVLAQKYRVLKTEGNFNNELGLPLTVFRLRDEDEIAVLEMGINHFGEMRRLAKVARPDMCIFTNIGICHLEFLKSRDGILEAKTEVFEYMEENAHVVINGDDDKLCTIRDVHGKKPISYGLSPDRDVWAEVLEKKGLLGTRVRIHTRLGEFDAMIKRPGIHMIYNALAATAAGLTYNLTLDEIKRGLETEQSIAGRFNVIEANGYLVIDDCYNANPVSMKASITVLKDADGRKVAVLGDMGELGDGEEALHRQVGAHVASEGIDVLLCVGPLSKEMAEEAKKAGKEMQVVHYETRDELIGALPSILRAGDTILVKASHAMHFEEVVKSLS